MKESETRGGQHSPVDPGFLAAMGTLAQVQGVAALGRALEPVVIQVSDADDVKVFVRSHDRGHYLEDHSPALRALALSDCVGGAALIEKGMIIVEASRFAEWPNEPLIGPESAALGAWPINGDLAMLVHWTKPRVPNEPDLVRLGTIARLAGQAMRRFRSSSDLTILAESRTQSLQAVNEEMETFAYTMSHDLKTPLTILKTSIWTLRQILQDQLDERATLAIDRLETTVERMRGQVNGMLHMYRLTKDDLHPEVVDISALSREILEGLRALEPDRVLEAIIAPNIRVRGDAAMLQVVMENLLDNAWKYTSKTPEARIEVGTFPDEHGQAVIFVRDNGAGFASDKKDRLFNVFQRLHTEDEFEGSGIGLASVQRIINKHGGRVWGTGEQGNGALFCFTLPEELPADELDRRDYR